MKALPLAILSCLTAVAQPSDNSLRHAQAMAFYQSVQTLPVQPGALTAMAPLMDSAPEISTAMAQPSSFCLGSSTNLTAVATTPPVTSSNFTGTYAPVSWIFDAGPGGSMSSGFPANLSLTSGNSAAMGYTIYSRANIHPTKNATVSFNWSYTTSDVDGPAYDPPLFFVNGNVIALSTFASSGSVTQSGSQVVNITAGQSFALAIYTSDGQWGSASVTYSNFTVSYAADSFVEWYTQASGGTSIGTSLSGQPFTVAPLSAGQHSYYAQAVSPTNGISFSRYPVTVTVLPNTTYYADADGDGFGDVSVPFTTCVGLPIIGGHPAVLNNTDCDDSNPAVHSQYEFYLDADQDGFGTGELTQVCAVNATTPPAGYSLNNTDCDDSDFQTNSQFFFYVDGDNDGFGTGSPVLACAANASTPPSGYSLNNTDCDDSNPSIHATFPFYADGDGDGYGAGSIQVLCAVNATTPPAGYAVLNGDCNDADPTVHASYYFYADGDSDGYGAGSPVLLCAVNASTPPLGYVTNNSDCNDSDNAMHQAFPFYVDADGDGFGTGFAIGLCAVNANTPPAGYALNNTDCNDADNSMHATFFFYVDSDGDGYGTGSLVPACAVNASTPPSGYSLNNTDCNDADATAWQMGMFYVDADNDGYTTGETASVCYGLGAPSGFVAENIGIDCNDGVAAINPGAPEVLYNGVDDNCDGNLDEGFQILSQITPAQCGTTILTISSLISATTFNNSTGYRFEVTNTSTNQVQVIDRPLQWFSLTMLEQYDYATTYSIRVMVQRNGIWLGYYGPACQVSSPAILDAGGAAQISASQCGITLPTINTLIATNSIPNTTGYRFRVTNLTDASTPNQVQVITRSLHWFAITMLPTYNYGTTYLIEVAVKTNGEFSGYGSPCVVATPNVPSLTSCDVVIPTSGTIIASTSKSNTTSYRFELTNLSNNVVVTIDRPVHWFRFNMVPGYAPNTEYGVRVALMTSGVYSLYGDACVITSPGAAREGDIKPVVEPFNVVAYPNPFADTFGMQMTTSADQSVSIRVFDMTGRLVETREVEVSALENVKIGDRYPAGVYNVVVSQGAEVKTLRVVKR